MTLFSYRFDKTLTLLMLLSTSFPGLQCEDEARHEEALVWAGHVSTQKMAVFDSYSSRSGEILNYV